MMRKSQTGFTLIEIMIVVAIVAIIAAIAFPSYQEQIRKTRRADGKALLSNISQQLERCYTKYGSYNNANCPVVGINQDSEDGFYNITVNAGDLTATTYNLTATALGPQLQDNKCLNLTLDQAGQQGISGAGPIDECW